MVTSDWFKRRKQDNAKKNRVISIDLVSDDDKRIENLHVTSAKIQFYEGV